MKNKNLLKFITISFFVIFIFSVPIITLFTEDKKISEIENKIDNLEDLKSFNLNGYKYNENLSSDTDFIFTR